MWERTIPVVFRHAGAAVFPMTEPEGCRAANDAVLNACSGGLVAFCRVTPDEPGEAPRCVEAGAAGIKLHPASDKFELGDDRLALWWPAPATECPGGARQPWRHPHRRRRPNRRDGRHAAGYPQP